MGIANPCRLGVFEDYGHAVRVYACLKTGGCCALMRLDAHYNRINLVRYRQSYCSKDQFDVENKCLAVT